MLHWNQIKLFAPKELVEEWSDIILTTGASAVTLHDKDKQAIFEPLPGDSPLWEQVQIIGLYDANINIDLIKEQLYEHLDKNIVLQVETIAEQDWQNTWKADLKPMQFGNKLWICPSWCEIPEPNAINIILDPGMAFGTGTHPTTALCLEWIAENINPLDTVLDFGCGSGILGIAAAKVGASMVHCVDCDPQALLSTQDNASRNSILAQQLCVYEPHKLPNTLQVETVLANILANPLVELADTLAHYVKPAGSIVLSGVLINQAEDIITAYSQWFEQLNITTKDEWVRISGTKKCK